MEYLEFASSLPIDALEIDIRRSKDGRLLLTHDPIRKRQLLTLDEAFAFLAGRNIAINCDLKEYGLEEDVLECADKYGIRNRIIFTGSVTDCMNFKKNHSDVQVFINAEELVPNFHKKTSPDMLINRCKHAGYQVINIDYRICDDRLVNGCKQAGIGLSVWTVDDIEMIKRLRAIGVVNLATNLVAEACEEKRTQN